MCRVLFAAGNGESMVELVNALVNSSKHDPYKVALGKSPSHKDGWGFIWMSEGKIEHYKTTKPIFEDKEGVESLLGSLKGFGVLLAHTRAASQGSVNIFNTQPFSYSSPEGFTFWFYHNGDLKKDEIIKMAGFREEKLKDASDSYVFGLYLLKRLSSFGEEEVLNTFKEALPTVKTTLNTGTLFTAPNEVKAFVTAYMVEEREKDTLHKRYSRLLKLETKDLFAVVSSTFEQYSSLPFQEIPNRKAFYVDMDLGRKEFGAKELTL
ncbi:class II glutamine amidotransferase [Thermococcus aggregans]|uniref:Class II glutamine amidotransferase n=1 Tax=Thermococcus aggregans TaxID=110163 RepID=A0A9E7SPK5_THEAG|nr:class II glutamine amidotransferase [Thermococcus aggregans]USS41723.1 class II glutamine amidotransferase [Thermococcus aggregans]